MKASEVLQAWTSILAGRAPSLSIEITKECPLRCPGCYAFDAAHLGSDVQLRQLSDFKGDELVTRILAIIDEKKPLHVSLVGGDPLVRYRELDILLPEIDRRGIHCQVVTSAFRTIPVAWNDLKRLNVVVSIDGLQPEHDERRKPATYERILKNIAGGEITVVGDGIMKFQPLIKARFILSLPDCDGRGKFHEVKEIIPGDGHL